MRYLILSDIHSNWEALSAVLADATGQYDTVLCCGDVVGYGADPNPVTDWVRSHAAITIRGNHDRACAGLAGIDWFNPIAQLATKWTHANLTQENRDWLGELPQGPSAIEDFQIVHGSPLHEDEYLVSVGEAAEAFAYVESPLTFFGHTHVQCAFEQRRMKTFRLHPAHLLGPLQIDDTSAYLVNPGSVGQPRDGDPRSGYAIYDRNDRTMLLRRVGYDISKAQNKIVNAGLPTLLAERLEYGG